MFDITTVKCLFYGSSCDIELRAGQDDGIIYKVLSGIIHFNNFRFIIMLIQYYYVDTITEKTFSQ